MTQRLWRDISHRDKHKFKDDIRIRTQRQRAENTQKKNKITEKNKIIHLFQKDVTKLFHKMIKMQK